MKNLLLPFLFTLMGCYTTTQNQNVPTPNDGLVPIIKKKNYKPVRQSNPDLNFLDFIEGTKDAIVVGSKEWRENLDKGDERTVNFSNLIN